ncbi:MAG: tricarballylate utilization 4Fe-4S protein TcuB [Pseudolabrys sp.]|nr:tricarballylate utilization 4Fe-4S protein TcuB [Pseudolabrys sp.]
MATPDHLREAERLMTICNACRYCEGLCAVFPAMEMRRVFSAGDLVYLANLCHQCGSCYSDCQYSPPHEFAVNVPAALAQLRNDSYRDYAWPGALRRLFDRNGLAVTLIAALSVAAFIIGFIALTEPDALFGSHTGDFYKVMPHTAMAALFSAVALYVIAALTLSVRAFCGDISCDKASGAAFAKAGHDAATLRYLSGGGAGCTSENEMPSALRRIYHHFTFYGFLLCFAATCVATIYHYVFGWPAPYGFASAPVVLGTLGGLGLLIGPAGLYALSRRRDPILIDAPRRDMDTAFLAMLFATSLTGFALLLLRDTPAMGVTLALHLGVVLGLFLSLPYGKFVHGLYRFAALAKYARERRTAVFID